MTWSLETGTHGGAPADYDAEEIADMSIPPLQPIPLLGQEGFLYRGYAHVIAGGPKFGKSTLTTAIVLDALAANLSVYWLSEEPMRKWYERIRPEPHRWRGLRVGDAYDSDPKLCLAHARKNNRDIVIVDTIRSILHFEDERDNSEVTRVVRPWIALCRETEMTLICLHHTTKAPATDGRAIAGGTALLGAFDVGIEVAKDGDGRKLTAYSRLAQPDDLRYRWEDGIFTVSGPRTCEAEGCTNPAKPRGRFCSDACRKRTSRAAKG